MIVQVALSVVLLAGAGLFIRSLRKLEAVDLGFNRSGILTMEVTPEQRSFGSAEWLNLQSKIIDRIGHIPGVQSVAFATMNPFSGRDRGAIVDVPNFLPRAETDKFIHLAAISPEYFDTLSVPVMVGRKFTARDGLAGPKAAILNETAARFYFGDASPLGRKIRFTNYPGRELVYEIAGVVRDMKFEGLREPTSRFIYVPIPQSADRINRLALAVRVSGDPTSFAEPVRREVQSAGGNLLITNVSTMEKQIGTILLRERLIAALSTTFGSVALVLSCIGLYGILAYAVNRRTNEIGIRMALGADTVGIVWLIVREALALAASGIVIGLATVLALGRLVKALLYGVEAFDPLTFASAGCLLLVFTAFAAILPSRRASLLDPTSALRSE